MRRPLVAAAILAAALGACAPRAQSGPGPRGLPLPALTDSVLATPPLDRTHWGVEVVDLSGRVLLARNADKLFIPASNTKVLTIAAALELLGPDHRWATTLELRGSSPAQPDALVVRGSGDPTLSGQFHDDPLAPLDSLADSLALAGVRRIAGPVIIDQGRFDSVLVHPAWEHGDLDWYYAAPVAPFAVLEAAIPVAITPAEVGAPAAVDVLLPPGLVGADALVRTVADDDGWDDELRRIAGTDSLVLRGEVGADADPDTAWIAQDEPGRLAGRALVLALERRGIQVAGPVVVVRDTAAVVLPAGPVRTLTWRSAPLSEVARVALEQSDNWITEQVLKTLGAERGEGGSWSDGTEVVETFLVARVGIDSTAVYLRDGSGLSAQNLITPRALTTLLRYAAVRPWGEVFRDALASPGEPEGTLEERLTGYGDRVAAKTGTIRHVNALSGYARGPRGEVLVFSLLTNASGRPSSEVRRALDRIVETILTNGSEHDG